MGRKNNKRSKSFLKQPFIWLLRRMTTGSCRLSLEDSPDSSRPPPFQWREVEMLSEIAVPPPCLCAPFSAVKWNHAKESSFLFCFLYLIWLMNDEWVFAWCDWIDMWTMDTRRGWLVLELAVHIYYLLCNTFLMIRYYVANDVAYVFVDNKK